MRETKLSYVQEETLRDFLADCVKVDILLPDEIKNSLYSWMGYKIGPGGVRVHKDVSLALPFHTEASTFYKDTYDDDWQEVIDAQDIPDTGTSEQTEGN